jgi:glycosyltransferase involved in cell wall biosynthesis
MRPFVSICMIVRDEEPLLARCLESFAGAYDELVVVDTGSVDRTPEIAREHGARVERFEWRDDFAAARNFSCSFARGEWVFTPDGDEVLQPDGVGEKLAGWLRRMPERFDKLLVEQRTVVRGETVASLFVDRIFRNRPDLRWKYRIHEVIETPAERTAMTRDCHLLHDVAHKRRDDLRVGEERERMYLRALSLDIEDHPGDPRPVFYLAETLHGAGRHAEALQEFERYFELSEGSEPPRRAAAFRDAAAAAGASGDDARRRTYLYRSLEQDWRQAETYRALGELAMHHGNREEATHWLDVAARCEAASAGPRARPGAPAGDEPGRSRHPDRGKKRPHRR